MNPEAVRASHAAHGFFLELIEVALKSDWAMQAHVIAEDSGWSHKSIEKRLTSIRYHLDLGILPEAIAEMGSERCLSDWQRAMNAATGKAPGQAVTFSRRVPPELKEELNQTLQAIRSAVGCSDEDALRFLATIRNSQPQEILHLYRQNMGE